jgi:Uma2 family endonuclease
LDSSPFTIYLYGFFLNKVLWLSPTIIHEFKSYSWKLYSSKKIGKLFTSPLDVILEENLNVVQPDLIYIKNENMSIFHPNCHIQGVPDLLIEIVSSGSVARDTVEKYEVKEYWIVFPEQKIVEVFILKEGKYSLLCSTESIERIISSIELQDLKLNIEEIFT